MTAPSSDPAPAAGPVPAAVENQVVATSGTVTVAPISHAKRALFQVMAGGSAGFLEVCIMQPLDVVKTRIQIQATPTAAATAVGEVSGVFVVQEVFRNRNQLLVVVSLLALRVGAGASCLLSFFG